MLVTVDDMPIKTEIIAEARFKLDSPRYLEWCSVPCLSINDCFTAKLLANSHPHMDSSVEARDLIDLAVLRLKFPIPQSAIDKGENAYEVMRPLKEAVQSFQARSDFRDKCFTGLQIDRSQIPKIIDGIDGSSQTCPNCRITVRKELGDRIHSCPECHYETDRDIASAQELCNRGIETYPGTLEKHANNAGGKSTPHFRLRNWLSNCRTVGGDEPRQVA